MDFKTLLEKKYVLLDGAMGTMLQKNGLKLGGIPEELNFEHPELITKIHSEYIKSGADIVYTNTFGANRYKLEHSKYSVNEIVKKAISNAKDATNGTNSIVALDIGPIGQMLAPSGTLSFEEAYDIFKETLVAGKDADVIVFETMTDLLEIKAAVLAAKENTDKPIMCTMTFEDNMRTFTGCQISAMALTLEGLGVDAIGVNCSLGPKEMYPVIVELCKWTKLPIILKPNAGLPDPKTNTYDISPEKFAEYMGKISELGVKIYGGCCGTTPEYISALKQMLDSSNIDKREEITIETTVCSATNTVIINEPRIIGERINPTGKKLFKEALVNNNISYILNQAISQVNAGADILDVNVGLPGIDEKEMMVTVLKAIQSISDVPLQIDSTIPEVLEAALRVYNGKPLVNSVNGEEKSLSTVLPLVKKYGACVVGLTLDEGGIPKKAEDRFAIAKKILKRAVMLGIPKENICIDCLTLTASAEQEGVVETLKAVKMVKEQLGLKTVLGVSNISFGLPNRELINQNFLAMGLQNGLDLPIINPNVTAMTGTMRAYKLLMNIDKDSREYIKNYSNMLIKTTATTNGAQAGTNSDSSAASSGCSSSIVSGSDMNLKYAIENGLKEEGAKITAKLLETMDSMEIVNEMLIPALDEAGSKFEKGIIFLPQLILSAGVAQAAFEEIKKNISNKSEKPISKGRIVIATVKGDIHDIGKNIVKVLLENYGYTVIDLGKDVEYQEVVDAAIKNKAKLVGLSALMTTTLVSMEKTIELLRENNVDCKIMVGGAVLTPEYAKKIGADYYAKDAKESVDIAKKVLTQE